MTNKASHFPSTGLLNEEKNMQRSFVLSTVESGREYSESGPLLRFLLPPSTRRLLANRTRLRRISHHSAHSYLVLYSLRKEHRSDHASSKMVPPRPTSSAGRVGSREEPTE